MLTVLCCTEIASWGVLYYAFPVLLPAITADTGWSNAVVSGAFSAGQILSACTGFFVGRLVDRRGPRAVMTAGSVLGVAGLLLAASARSVPMLFAGWLVVGLACAGTLYLPAFAAVTRFFGEGRVRALTALTVVGGFASTVFAPVTGVLSAHLGWREALVVLAVAVGAVTIPLHAWGLPSLARGPASGEPGSIVRAGPGRPVGSNARETTDAPPASVRGRVAGATAGAVPAAPVRSVITSLPFLALALALTIGGFVGVALVVQLLPALGEWGVGAATASVLLGLVGVGQVLGRLVFGPFASHTSPVGQTAWVLAGTAAVPLIILLPGGTVLGVVLCLLLGLMRGSLTMIGATAVAERWGIAHFGAINGALSTPVDLARAVAPWGGAALAAGLGSFRMLFLAAAVLAAVAAVVALASRPARATEPR